MDTRNVWEPWTIACPQDSLHRLSNTSQGYLAYSYTIAVPRSRMGMNVSVRCADADNHGLPIAWASGLREVVWYDWTTAFA